MRWNVVMSGHMGGGGQIRSNEVKWDQVWSSRVTWSGSIGVKWGQIRSNRVRLSQRGQMRSIRVKSQGQPGFYLGDMKYLRHCGVEHKNGLACTVGHLQFSNQWLCWRHNDHWSDHNWLNVRHQQGWHSYQRHPDGSTLSQYGQRIPDESCGSTLETTKN